MSKRIENKRVKGGMKRYREQHAGDAGVLGTLAKAPLVLPPDDDMEDALVESRSQEPQKRSMVSALVTIHLLAIAGFAAYHFINPSAETTALLAETVTPRPLEVPMPPTASTTAGYTTHEVKGADSWASVAAKHEITEGELRSANPNVSSLTLGRILSVPPKQNIIAAATEEEKPTVSEISTAPAPGAGEKSFILNNSNPGYNRYLNVLRPEEQPLQRRITPRQINPDPAVTNAPAVAQNTPPSPPLRTIDPPPEAPPSPPRAKIVEETAKPKMAREAPKPKASEEKPKTPRARIVDEPAESRQQGKPQTVAGNKNAHTVQRGDTLYGVSKRLGISVDELKAINGLKSDNILDGQTLKGKR